MRSQSIALRGLLHATAATVYIGLVAFMMSHANAWFGQKDTAFTPVAVLMLFTLSAAVMASLIFLRPLLWYMDGKKREALTLLGWTIGFLFVLTIAAFVILALTSPIRS